MWQGSIAQRFFYLCREKQQKEDCVVPSEQVELVTSGAALRPVSVGGGASLAEAAPHSPASPGAVSHTSIWVAVGPLEFSVGPNHPFPRPSPPERAAVFCLPSQVGTASPHPPSPRPLSLGAAVGATGEIWWPPPSARVTRGGVEPGGLSAPACRGVGSSLQAGGVFSSSFFVSRLFSRRSRPSSPTGLLPRAPHASCCRVICSEVFR